MELIITAVTLALIGLALIVIYNGMVAARQKVDEAWSGITVQLKRRHDLVGNLVAMVQAAQTHEKSLLESVVKSRQLAVGVSGGSDPDAVAMAERKLTASLSGFFALAEDYPDISSNQNVMLLQKQIEETEDQIAASRRLFNGNVQSYNTRIQSIPANLIAAPAGFHPASFFELSFAAATAAAEPSAVAL